MSAQQDSPLHESRVSAQQDSSAHESRGSTQQDSPLHEAHGSAQQDSSAHESHIRAQQDFLRWGCIPDARRERNQQRLPRVDPDTPVSTAAALHVRVLSLRCAFRAPCAHQDTAVRLYALCTGTPAGLYRDSAQFACACAGDVLACSVLTLVPGVCEVARWFEHAASQAQMRSVLMHGAAGEHMLEVAAPDRPALQT